jgi:transcription elongation factor Elf1
MVVTCPHCHASYRLATTIRNAVLVCHRCGQEFTSGEAETAKPGNVDQQAEMPLFDWQPATGEQATAEEPETISEPLIDGDEELPHFLLKENQIVGQETEEPPAATADAMEDATESEAVDAEASRQEPETTEAIIPQQDKDFEQQMLDAALEPAKAAPGEEPAPETEAPMPDQQESTSGAADTMAPPTRRKARIWPWLLFILLSAAAAGVWFKQDAWLQNSWVRSTLINLGVSLPLQGSDWRIDRESVHSQWLTRDDKSRILIIEGKVSNLLFSELPPPTIRVALFDLPGARKPVATRDMAITEPPSLPSLKKTPFTRPANDRLPIAGEGSRSFVLVLEKLPEGIRDFSLIPIPPAP